MKYYQICRFCHKASYETPSQGMVRYSIRHWAHWNCAIERFGFENLVGKLNHGQIANIPLNVIDGHPNRQTWMEKWKAE